MLFFICFWCSSHCMFFLFHCLSLMPVTALLGIQVHRQRQQCKDEDIFSLGTASQTSRSSLHVKCAQEGHLRSARPGLLRPDICTVGVMDPHQPAPSPATALPGCQRACSLPAIPGPSCLWRFLWRLQTQRFETLALFGNFADIIIEGKQIVCNAEHIVLPYTILRKAFLLIWVWRGFPGFETVGEIFKPFRHSNKQT